MKTKKKQISNLLEHWYIHLLIYVLFVFVVNIFMFCGMDMLKFDIMDAHYPNGMFLSNAIREGILPLWAPLYDYGVPYYANVGAPVYYPTTVFFAFWGYRLWMVAAEFCIHVVIACYGMNRYVLYILKDKSDTFASQCCALIIGLLYGFSGTFWGNAQHIMIIISAAWVPLIFLFINKYFSEERKIYLACAAACTGLSVQGGYPEIWIMMIIVLIPYMFMCIKEENVWDRIKTYIKSYFLYGILVLSASAITVIPTIVLIKFMPRLSGNSSIVIDSYMWRMWLSFLIPRCGRYMDTNRTVDASMISVYTGFFVVLLMVNVLLNKWDRKKYYLFGMSIFIAIMMMGNNMPLHPLFQKYFPMFNNLRFPPLYRCFLSFFMLILVVNIFYEIFQADKREIRIFSISLAITNVALLSSKILLLKMEEHGILRQSSEVYKGCVYVAVILIMMAVCMVLGYRDIIKKDKIKYIVVFLIFLEVTMVYRLESPITVGYIGNGENLFAEMKYMKNEYAWYDMRNRNREETVDYSKSLRGSAYGTNVREAVIKNELSEVVPTQVKLSFIQNYKQKANRYIIQGNPVFYFTNDIVTANDVNYGNWSNDWGVNSKQIFIEDSVVNNTEEKMYHELNVSEIIEKVTLEIEWNDNIGKVFYAFNELDSSQHNAKWKIYVSEENVINETLVLSFYTESGECETIEMKISDLYQDEKGKFIYGCFPRYTKYIQMEFALVNGQDIINGFEYVESVNEAVSDDIEVREFTPNKIELDVTEEKEGYLVALQTDYPGWNVYVDGGKKEIVKVNGVFRGVYLTEGNHEVVFKFIPIDFWIGAFITIVFYSIFSIFVFIRKVGKTK